MKLLTKLPGILRVLFGVLRIMTAIMAVFWVVTLAYNSWIQKACQHDARLFAQIGEISLPVSRGAVGFSSDTATPGSLALHGLHGTLRVDLCSQDPALSSAVRGAVIPSRVALILFCHVVFTSLRDLCANLERGEVFNDGNLRHVRWVGVSLIACSIIGAGLEIWDSRALQGYFGQHVVVSGLQLPVGFADETGPLQFALSPGLMTTPGGVLIGCLVLIVAEASRQGLLLKTESDLTV